MLTNKWAALLTLLLVLVTHTAIAEDKASEQKLFVNLTSNEIKRATMAIMFATRVRQQKQMPVTIFLNVDGVQIANKNQPEIKNVMDKSLKTMLQDFMKAGGRVIICPMCMKNAAGITQADLIEGVELGGPDVTWLALFAENTTVLSY